MYYQCLVKHTLRTLKMTHWHTGSQEVSYCALHSIDNIIAGKSYSYIPTRVQGKIGSLWLLFSPRWFSHVSYLSYTSGCKECNMAQCTDQHDSMVAFSCMYGLGEKSLSIACSNLCAKCLLTILAASAASFMVHIICCPLLTAWTGN